MRNVNENFIILAIDTSCDDTSVAITKGRKVLTNCVSSQIEMHKKTGGVVPIDAARAHDIKLDPLINLALKKSKLDLKEINAISVTYGPGLAPALDTGVQKAKILSLNLNIPLIPVNHMAGHTYANFAQNSEGNESLNDVDSLWPRIVLLISGGHTEIVLMKSHFDFEIIGETLDDACGECFDKVGRMLGLGYPAGPVIEKFALLGNDNKYNLPSPMSNTKDFNVSYSGLKTATFKLIKAIANVHGIDAKPYLTQTESGDISLSSNQTDIDLHENKIKSPPGTDVFILSKEEICDICASFQKAAIDTIITKLDRALKTYKPKELLLGGGVVKNKLLRKQARKIAKNNGINFHYPKDTLIVDNAAMIGIAGLYQYEYTDFILRTKEEIERLQRDPSLTLSLV